MNAVTFVFQNNRNGIKILIICKINKSARPKCAANNKKHKIMGNILKKNFILKILKKSEITWLSIYCREA
jgi:hypothetical protein